MFQVFFVVVQKSVVVQKKCLKTISAVDGQKCCTEKCLKTISVIAADGQKVFLFILYIKCYHCSC